MTVELVKLSAADFNSVNCMPILPSWFERPMNVQFVVSEDKTKVFVHVMTELNKYD